jgi:hypothetical protein
MNHYSFVACILGYQLFIDRFASAAAAAAAAAAAPAA